jgi:hypothetical protein
VKLSSQNATLILKHHLLLNVCNHKFLQFFVTAYLVRYINDLVFHFLPLNITRYLIDFVLLMMHYPWRNRRKSAGINLSVLVSCKLSVKIRSFLR